MDTSDDAQPYDAIVLGSGISGLVSAAVLSEQGCRRIVVVDEYGHVGGNHIDCSFGAYTFDIGSLIFQDDSPLLRYFPELLERYVEIQPSWGKLNPQGEIVQYPISLRKEIIGAGFAEWIRMFLSVAYARLTLRRARNAREFAQFWIGDRLMVRSGLETYMERFFGIEAEKVDVVFATKRMLWIREHALARTWVRKWFSQSKSGPANRQLARPPEGFGHLYEPVRRKLERSGIRFNLGNKLTTISTENDGFLVRGEGIAIRAKRVIATIPLDKTADLCGFGLETGLSYVMLLSLFYSFEGKRGFEQSILYNFSHKARWKRLTVYSDFYGARNGREYFSVEYIATCENQSHEAAHAEFQAHVQDNGLFRGDLRLEGSRSLPFAYPIYTQGAAERAAGVIAKLRNMGVESFGRQGGFDYQPTARVSTITVEERLNAPSP